MAGELTDSSYSLDLPLMHLIVVVLCYAPRAHGHPMFESPTISRVGVLFARETESTFIFSTHNIVGTGQRYSSAVSKAESYWYF